MGQQDCASTETIENLVSLFSNKGRYDETTGKVKEAWQLKIFRTQALDELHKDFIAANRIYTDEENSSLNDLFADSLDANPALIAFG